MKLSVVEHLSRRVLMLQRAVAVCRRAQEGQEAVQQEQESEQMDLGRCVKNANDLHGQEKETLVVA